jgi:hypothetical protein
MEKDRGADRRLDASPLQQEHSSSDDFRSRVSSLDAKRLLLLCRFHASKHMSDLISGQGIKHQLSLAAVGDGACLL